MKFILKNIQVTNIVELGKATHLTMGGGNFGIESFTLKPFMPSKS